jgi:hypothetical protein
VCKPSKINVGESLILVPMKLRKLLIGCSNAG